MDNYMSIEDKEKELYESLIEKLYRFFIMERREARVDTVVHLLGILKPVGVNETEIETKKRNFEEVDII